MKTTRYILLVIGILGLITALFGLINGDALTDQLITIVCGSSLIYGYFQLKNSTEIKN
ncbi:hypothetical protein [Psychroserpens sp.]|uniref:hypothetical protein n=1 Tax=Psychroserpens sp. TaxID=2020870 RepID=UPI00385FE4CC